MTRFLPRFGVETTFVDGRDAQKFRNAIRENTKIIYLESPNSMLFELQDLEAVTAIAQGVIRNMNWQRAKCKNMEVFFQYD